MNTIKTLAELREAIQNGGADFALPELAIDQAAIEEEIRNLDFDVEPAQTALTERHSILVPDDIIRDILCENLWLACKVSSGEIHEKSEVLFSAVCEHVGINPDVCFAPLEEYKLAINNASEFGLKFME